MKPQKIDQLKKEVIALQKAGKILPQLRDEFNRCLEQEEKFRERRMEIKKQIAQIEGWYVPTQSVFYQKGQNGF